MEFLYRLYSNNYFGIGLFIVIALLAFTFLAILFFGKKDEKARMKQDKEKELERKEVTEEIKEEAPNENEVLETMTLNETTSLQETNETKEEIASIDLEEESIFNKEPVLEEQIVENIQEPISLEETSKEEDLFVTSNMVLNTDYINEEPVSLEENVDSFGSNSDIYNLDSIINENKEETIDDVLNKYDAVEETIIELPNQESIDIPKEENAPIVEEEKNDLDVFSKPNENKKMSTPFSSVYLTKEEAETKKEEVVEEDSSITPNQKAFELPKKVELPKRNANAINENVIASLRGENKNQ